MSDGDLIALADRAMYQVKHGAKGGVALLEDVGPWITSRQSVSRPIPTPRCAAASRSSRMSGPRSCSTWPTMPTRACAARSPKTAQTPRQADLILTRDVDESVRERLAAKISALVPEFSKEDREKVRALSDQVLETLARDHAVKVRQIVAEALKDSVDAPLPVIRKLARDIEIQVAGPILEHSPLLTDEDLLEIIAAGPIRGALNAIAKRRQLSDKLSDGGGDRGAGQSRRRIQQRAQAAAEPERADPRGYARPHPRPGQPGRRPGTSRWWSARPCR